MEELLAANVRIEAVTGLLHLHGEDMRAIESGIGGEQPLQTVQQQARAHQEHQRKRDFGHDQRASGESITSAVRCEVCCSPTADRGATREWPAPIRRPARST